MTKKKKLAMWLSQNVPVETFQRTPSGYVSVFFRELPDDFSPETPRGVTGGSLGGSPDHFRQDNIAGEIQDTFSIQA